MNNRIITTICYLMLSAAFREQAISATVSNGSFESGLVFWTVVDHPRPIRPPIVMQRGAGTFFSSLPVPNIIIPSEGRFALSHEFDGIEPGLIRLFQDIGVPLSGESVKFDYRVAWDLLSFGATLNRTFAVEIEPAGGGIPFASFTIFTAVAGTTGGTSPNSDTGPLTGTVDLTPFAGISIRAEFVWEIPEMLSGPANFQLDDVQIVPEPSAALLAWGGLTVGLMRRFRRSHDCAFPGNSRGHSTWIFSTPSATLDRIFD